MLPCTLSTMNILVFFSFVSRQEMGNGEKLDRIAYSLIWHVLCLVIKADLVFFGLL